MCFKFDKRKLLVGGQTSSDFEGVGIGEGGLKNFMKILTCPDESGLVFT